MRIILLANHFLALTAADYLAQQGYLNGVVLPDRITPNSHLLEEKAAGLGVQMLKVGKPDIPSVLKEWMNPIQTDVAFVIGFPYRLPATLFSSARLGFFNFHGGLLPQYRGPDPIFWQIRNGASQGGLTVHQMDDSFDTGPILLHQPIPMIPGETYGIHVSRLGELMPRVLAEAVSLLSRQKAPLTSQTEESAGYQTRPTPDDLMIRWETQSARAIENLINASNPAYGGALTYFKGNPIRILEVTPADLKGNASVPPGTIVHADQNHGAFVSCIGNEFLRINIVSCNEGILTSFKLSAMGLKAGDLLYTPAEIPSAVTKPIQHN